MIECVMCKNPVRVMTPPAPGICSDICLKAQKEVLKQNEKAYKIEIYDPTNIIKKGKSGRKW